MVDIHCHILPGLDDGPDSIETSLEMGEARISEGVTHLVATPQANDRFPFIPDLVQSRRDEIQQRLGDRFLLATGCDFHVSYENLPARGPCEYFPQANRFVERWRESKRKAQKCH